MMDRFQRGILSYFRVGEGSTSNLSFWDLHIQGVSEQVLDQIDHRFKN